MPLTSAELVEQVEAAARVIFAPRPFPLATREVKTFFGDLGRSLDFRICASGYKGADDGEWRHARSMALGRGGRYAAEPSTPSRVKGGRGCREDEGAQLGRLRSSILSRPDTLTRHREKGPG